MRKLLFLLLLVVTASPAIAQFRPLIPYSPLKRPQGYVDAGWYISSDVYKYLADVDISFDFGSLKDVGFNFRGGILTLIKTTDDESFQPDRYRGTLEPGAYYLLGKNAYAFSIRHQSYHTIDREPVLEESYELYDLTYQYNSQPNIVFAIGKYMNTEDVDYDWDFYAQVDTGCVGSCRYGKFYFDLIGHYVTEDGDIDRDSFFDYNIEVGLQTKTDVKYYTAYRVVHDIDQFDGTTDHQWILGLKYLW